MVEGRGLRGLQSPGTGITLDVGNSGTSIRLLTGLLAAQSFETVISGDMSIQGRPMKRIVDPLTGMGARISGQSRPGSEDIFPPLRIQPVDSLNDIDYVLPMASAQVKSAVLLAGLYTDHVSIDEPEHSRDHTERLMSYYGAPINSYGKRVTLQKMESLKILIQIRS